MVEVVAPEEPEDEELELGEEELELDAVDDEPEEAELTVRVLRRELEEDFFAAVDRLTETAALVVVLFVAVAAARTTCVLPVAMTAVRIAVPAAAAAAVRRVIRLVRRNPAARALRRRVFVSVMSAWNQPGLASVSGLLVSSL
ncbi:MAG TPA: hypothetical protein VLJ76_02810 [Gaiellaceae bacterium]|nr:hypothetical protein [Gaiellaceae bacterium]